MKINKFIFSIIFIIFSSLSFNSCIIIDDDRDNHHYHHPLVGQWELVGTNYGTIPNSEIDYFYFYDNGSGVYEAYDKYYRWSQWRFSWDEYAYGYNNIIEIYFDDGEIWEYYWELDRDYLYLYDIYNPNIYYIYRYY